MGLAELSGVVPMVCLVLGASAGHGALTAPLSDFAVMTESASIFAAGPPLVKSATGEDVTKEVLGGPQLAVEASGVVQNVVADDVEAIALARRYLDVLSAQHVGAPHQRHDGADSGLRRLDTILDLIPASPRRPYPIHPVLEALVDHGSLLMIQPTFGRSIVTALARLGGRSVAIVANDPSVMAGTVDSEAADKVAHFLDVAGAFGLPVRVLGRQPWRPGGQPGGATGDLASCGADVRRSASAPAGSNST